MMETRALRDSAHTVQDAMYQRLDGGDRAAALFYADRLERVGKELKQRQEKFESHLSRILSGDQVKAYKAWRKEQDRLAQLKAEEEAVRWRASPFGVDRPAAEPKTFVDQPDLPRPDAGSQAVRVGRTIYVASQVALDPAGTIVGESDLARQAVQAFANLTRVLDAARALPSDVVRLTIYVVNYQPANLAVIRQAGAAYFPVRDPPVVTVVGVQSLSRPGLLIAVEATAVEGGGFAPQRAGPPRR